MLVGANLLAAYVGSHFPLNVLQASMLDKKPKFVEAWSSSCDVFVALRLSFMAEGHPRAAVKQMMKSLIKKLKETPISNGPQCFNA